MKQAKAHKLCAWVARRQNGVLPSSSISDHLEVLLLQLLSELIQREMASFRNDFIVTGQGAHVGQLQFSIQKTAEGGLCVPIVERDRQLQLGVLIHPASQQLPSNQELALIESGYFRPALLSAPHAQQILAPFLGIAFFEVVSLQKSSQTFWKPDLRRTTPTGWEESKTGLVPIPFE